MLAVPRKGRVVQRSEARAVTNDVAADGMAETKVQSQASKQAPGAGPGPAAASISLRSKLRSSCPIGVAHASHGAKTYQVSLIAPINLAQLSTGSLARYCRHAKRHLQSDMTLKKLYGGVSSQRISVVRETLP